MSKKVKLLPGQVWKGYGGRIRQFVGWTSKGGLMVENLADGTIDLHPNNPENRDNFFLLLVRDERGVRCEENIFLGIEEPRGNPLPKVKNIMPAPHMRLPLDSPEHSELFEEVRDKPELWTETVLYKIGRNNVAVNCFLNLQARGDLSHEQALMGSVLYLCEQNRRLMNQAKEFYWKFPGPLPFPKDVKAPAEDTEPGKEKG